MKILGAFLIIGVCWMFGVDFYKSNYKKLEFAKGLFAGMEYLKSEITYTCDLLGESLQKASSFSGVAGKFFESIAFSLEKKGTSTQIAFEENELYLAQNANNETYLLTKDLILQLGEKDCENQEKMLESYLSKLSLIIKKQEEFCQKECTMFKKTGAIAGLGIVVLLI